MASRSIIASQFWRGNYGMWRNDVFDLQAEQECSEQDFDARLFLDWTKDPDNAGLDLLEVQFCRVWHSEITMTPSFPFLPILSHDKPQQTCLVPFPVLLGYETHTPSIGTSGEKSLNSFSCYKENHKALKEKLLHRKAGPWLSGLEWNQPKVVSVCQMCHFCIGQISGAGLQEPISAIIQHEVNSPDMQNLVWLTESKHKTFY